MSEPSIVKRWRVLKTDTGHTLQTYGPKTLPKLCPDCHSPLDTYGQCESCTDVEPIPNILWQSWAHSGILEGYTVRVTDPYHVNGGIVAYAIGCNDLKGAARNYASTTTDRSPRKGVVTLLVGRKGKTLIECDRLEFGIP